MKRTGVANEEVLRGLGAQAAGRNMTAEQRAVTTDDLDGTGALKQEAVKAFITAFEEAGELGGAIMWKKVGAKAGNLPRLTFGSRQIRAKQEKVAPESTVDPTPSTVAFSLKGTRLAYEIPEEVIEYNVEGDDYDLEVFEGMSNSFGIDVIDLGLNGDTATDPSDPDYKFLKILDGWLKKMTTLGGNILAAGSLPAGASIGKHIFFAAKRELPVKWKGRLKAYRWMIHPDTLDHYMETLSDGIGSQADQALVDGRTEKIVGIQYLIEPKMPVDQILLADPSQMAMVYNRNMKFRTTNDGVEAISEDKRFSVLIGDYDPIWYWADSAVLVTGITGVS